MGLWQRDQGMDLESSSVPDSGTHFLFQLLGLCKAKFTDVYAAFWMDVAIEVPNILSDTLDRSFVSSSLSASCEITGFYIV